ncbi:MAG: BPSS1780 family membrane protein [Pseudomonadota bacterium]
MSSLTVLRIPAAQGLAWIKQGWSLFMQAPVPWAGMTALVFLVLMGLGVLPFLGGLLVHVLSPFVVAGFLAASRAGLAGEPVTFLYLGAGFQQARNGLFVIGLAYMLATLLVFRAVAFFTGGDLDQLMAQLQNPHALSPEEAEALVRQVMPTLALGSLLLVPLLMATWFSPALVLFEGFAPGKAVWWSLWACGVNWRPLFVYSSLLALAGMAAVVIPFGLGLLVFIPLTLTSTYMAYRDIFAPVGEDAAP